MNMPDPEWIPLSLNYTWEGSFIFYPEKENQVWHYHDPASWKVRHESKSEGRFISLAEAVRVNAPTIFSLFKTAPDSTPSLLNWFYDADARDLRATGHVSIILNAIMHASQDRLYKPFEILSTFVDGHMTSEIRGLKDGAPCWFYLSNIKVDEFYKNCLLFCFDDFIDISTSPPSFKKDASVPYRESENGQNVYGNLYIDRLRYSRFIHRYHVTDFQPDKNSGNIIITLRDDMEIHEYVKGRICGCIPIAGQTPKKHSRNWLQEPAGVNSPEVVIISPAVSEALTSISRIWQDPFAQSVLISAPPGSGKEQYAKCIPSGNGRKMENLQTLSLADSNHIETQRRIFGYIRSDGSACEGLLAAAKDGAIFLDEVHQPGKSAENAATRAALLRPLESREYFPHGCNEIHKVENVLFVMATSKILVDLEDYEPQDFWTRVTHTVQIRHPFDLASVTDNSEKSKLMERVAAKFFAFFWWGRVSQHCLVSISSFKSNAKLKTDSVGMFSHRQAQVLLNLIRNGTAETFGRLFIEHCNKNNILPHQFSIRGVRSLVTRLFSIAAFAMAKSEDDLFESSGGFDKCLEVAFGEIKHIAKIKI